MLVVALYPGEDETQGDQRLVGSPGADELERAVERRRFGVGGSRSQHSLDDASFRGIAVEQITVDHVDGEKITQENETQFPPSP